VADEPVNFVAQLIVNNGYENSPPSTTTVTTTVIAPTANAGVQETVQNPSLTSQRNQVSPKLNVI
jgi:hypothetical protein